MSSTSVVDLVGVGLNATDTLIPLPHLPSRGSKMEYRQETVMPGGQVATAVVACQSWGMSTRYVGKLGDDDAARLHARAFAQAGVETRLVTAPSAASPRSLILVDGSGERTVLCRRDDRVALQPQDLEREWIVRARALHVDGFETAAATLAARWAREAGLPVTADLDEVYAGVDGLIEQVDYLIVSRDLPCRLMQESDLLRALRKIHSRYGCKLTAATLGPDGVVAWDGLRFSFSPAFRVPVVDTTGAGDIFHAGFLYGLAHGWELDRQLAFACAAAAMNCMASGARGGIRPVEEIEALLVGCERYPRPQEFAGVLA